MSELVDVRPSGLDAFFRPGDPFPLVLTWPAGSLAGRTFTSTLGAASLSVSILGDVMTVTASAAQTTAAAAVAAWKLTDTTPAEDVTVLVGRWAGSPNAAGHHEATVVVSDGSAAVQVLTQGMGSVGDLTVAGTLKARHPLVFWQHPVSQTVPNATWTPVAWNSLLSTVGSWTSYVPASTTIAVGSNGAVLPQGTINVADTSTFAAAGYIVVRISGTDRVIQYTSKNATQFLGCTFGVGTLATSQAVAQANVEFNMPDFPPGTVGPLIAETAWSSNGTGGRWTRLRALNALGAGFHLNGGTGYAAAIASTDPLIRSVCTEQPAFKGAGIPSRIEVHHTAGGGVNLDLPIDQLAAPRLVVQALSVV